MSKSKGKPQTGVGVTRVTVCIAAQAGGECRSTFQDMKYGVGQRIHNAIDPKNGGTLRCTVCGRVRA